MAATTNLNLRNKIIYQVFVRQYSDTHNFEGLRKDLKRIKDLGIDYIELLPIHPIGKLNRKGSIGSPYSVYDYYAINEDYGSLDDFKNLINDIHKLDMKIIMDIVFNHTSRDSILTQRHPEWFYKTMNGEFKNRVGDWSDVTDLNFEDKKTYEYLKDVLIYYTKLGVDGYRFDVASLIPYDFFEYAFKEVKKINNDIFLLAETIHLNFNKYIRDLGYNTSSDGELYNLFDAEYEYDCNDYLQQYLKGECEITEYLKRVYDEEAMYPLNYIKVRFIENHDFGRAVSFLNDEIRLKNILTLSYLTKGMMFLYNGIETLTKRLPNLFEIDEIKWENYNKDGIVDLIKKLNKIKKRECFINGIWDYKVVDDVVIISIKNSIQELRGIINLNHYKGEIKIDLYGNYKELLSDKYYDINGHVKVEEEALIFEIANDKIS